MQETDQSRATKGGSFCVVAGILFLALNIIPKFFGVKYIWAGSKPKDIVWRSGPYVDAMFWIGGISLIILGIWMIVTQPGQKDI